MSPSGDILKDSHTLPLKIITIYIMKQSLQHISLSCIIKKQWCDTNYMGVDDIHEG